jgi:type IV fimbrial biogenesis protein FimT
MNLQKGFTLIEMLATVGVATVLLAAATPSFVQMNRNSRIIGYTNEFVGTVNFARAEAIRRGSPVTICRSNDNATCSGGWSDGWIVFADPDSDKTVGDEDKEPLLRAHEPLATKFTLNASADLVDGVTYGGDGSASAAGIFAVCHDGNIEGARAIVLTRLRPRVALDTDGNRVPNTDAGELLDCTEP